VFFLLTSFFPLHSLFSAAPTPQFVSMIVQGGYCALYSPYPKFLSYLLFVYIISLLALFMNFYLRKHGAAAGDKQGAAGATPKRGKKRD
jgi:hypothetical protein